MALNGEDDSFTKLTQDSEKFRIKILSLGPEAVAIGDDVVTMTLPLTYKEISEEIRSKGESIEADDSSDDRLGDKVPLSKAREAT